MPTISNPRAVLARAITNDQQGLVSTTDAKRLVEASLKDIEKAKDPQAAFDRNKRLMDAARALAGQNQTANRTLETFVTKGQNAVSTRLSQMTGAGELPADVKGQFTALMNDLGALPVGGRVAIRDVKGDARKGFEFNYTSGPNRGTAHAIRTDDTWLLTPVKLTAADLKKATEAMHAWFDSEFAPELRESGSSAADIRAARKAMTPQYAFFPGSSDPQNLTDSYPVVLSFRNETGSDHGLYVGFNPENGDAEAYSFN